jgi:VIT1/CCC1 family predicted Fe2+/Mn2+ transporter
VTKSGQRASHTPEAIRERLEAATGQSYLRDVIYGAVDGAVTTFAIAAGAIGAGLSSSVVLVLGIANLLADGLSMAASNYLGIRADEERRLRILREEEAQLDGYPDGEREEIRQIYARKGFSGEDLERVVEVITADRERWLDTMLREEYDLPLVGRSARRAALATFVAFLVLGTIPLLPFGVNIASDSLVPAPFALSAVLTGLAFFLVGAAKGRVVAQPWLRGGIETLAIGGAAAIVAFAIGLALQGLVDGA